jgi:hypothetical protein
MKLQKAQRNQVKLRLGLSGASGFGESYSALLLAFGITKYSGETVPPIPVQSVPLF